MARIRDPIRSSIKRPYNSVVNVYKFPGIYHAYAAIPAVLGETVTGIHMGLLAVGLLSIVIPHLLARPLPGAAGAAPAGQPSSSCPQTLPYLAFLRMQLTSIDSGRLMALI
ncbi:MAG: hypothetical protein ABSF52_08780 [Syntrophobacteraceae bacterium]